MKKIAKLTILAVLPSAVALAQPPLSEPLADFDKLVSQLKTGSLVGEPVRAGETAIIPFAGVHFSMGAAGEKAFFGGGIGAKTVPMGVLIIEGDNVRVELFPKEEPKPGILQTLVQGLLDHKITFMANGLNIGNLQGKVEELAPLVSQMMGQTNLIVNGLNSGNMNPPRATAPKETTSAADLPKLLDSGKYEEALTAAGALVDKEPRNAAAHVFRGRALGGLARANSANLAKYGPGAMEEFEKALALEPDNPDAHIGRGISRLTAPEGFGGDLDGAIADFQAANAQKPSSKACYELGRAYERKSLPEKAAEAYRKAVDLDPHNQDAVKALDALKNKSL